MANKTHRIKWQGHAANSRRSLISARFSGFELLRLGIVRRLVRFAFHLALSAPLPEDAWSSHLGFIHEVVLRQYLLAHTNPRAVEYYLCGPPMMIKACTKVLADLGVPPDQIAYDEF